MELNTVKDAFDRVTKKQKLSYSKAQEVIDLIHREVNVALEKIQSGHGSDWKSVLAELKIKLKETAPLTQLEGTQKDLNISLSKYPKILEKSFNPDISKAYRNVDLDIETTNEIIANHFYRQGLFEVGDCFILESMEQEPVMSIKSPYVQMYEVLESMRTQNLEPALTWASANSSKLHANGSDLKLKLHQMQFLEILRKGSQSDAILYARAHLSPFATTHMIEIQKLMGCLLFAQKLNQSPYSELLSSMNWDKLAEEVTRQFCNLLGQSYESPLSVTVAAGSQALPPLLKFMNVMSGKKQEWQSMKQLPVPLELDDDFQFHSIFVCPVSKEQATEDNPPMLMSCGHVLCKQSIMKMSKNVSKTFKCPYCPNEINASQCKQLNF
ncbi:hypothetical protein SAY86_017203 [Trapa natans]|uniref:Uncharacterized protein n=1 Tax=Trapa natans TaxID=22666 RepID=A0AAN7LRN5_TRANT|nr:hypothetical protein SAY86_017203 [Trapa natans]